MCKILIFSKYIEHKKKIKVNNLTPDYGLNLIYPRVVFKFDHKERNLFQKKPELASDLKKMHFLLPIILSVLENGKTLHRFDLNFLYCIYCK